jgi:hypothetical protein
LSSTTPGPSGRATALEPFYDKTWKLDDLELMQ